jgi:GT2 family glycosyltransferase
MKKLTKNKIWTIVVDYQAKKTIKTCLKSIQLDEVIVINNNKRNRGFAKAVNWGMRKAIRQGAEAIFLLNPDARVTKGGLEDLMAKSADIVGAVIEDRNQRECGGVINWQWGRTEHLKCGLLGAEHLKIDFVSGCAMLIKRRVWEEIGFFDERFFMYYEDVDYCWRAQRAGLKIGVCEKVRIWHEIKAVRERTRWQNWQLVKSHWLFLRKYRLGLRPSFYWLALTGKILIR